MLALGAQDATAEGLIVSRKGFRLAVLSWYRTGSRITPNVHAVRLWLRLSSLFHASAAPGEFVRLATPVSGKQEDDDGALSRLAGFADLVLGEAGPGQHMEGTQ